MPDFIQCWHYFVEAGCDFVFFGERNLDLPHSQPVRFPKEQGSMPVTVHHAQRADLPRIFDVFYASMIPISLLRASGDVPNLDKPDSESAATAREDAIARFGEILDNHPKAHFLKAVEDETGEIAGFAIWYFFTGSEGKADWMKYTETAERMRVPRGVPEEGYRYAWGKMHEKYREVFGGEDGWREHYR